MTQPRDSKPLAKQVKLKYIYPEDLQTHFVSNIVVDHQPDRFVISFFEVFPPPVLAESDADRQRIVDSLDSIDAKCVARLVVTPQTMEQFVRVMSENFGNYRELMQRLMQSELGEQP